MPSLLILIDFILYPEILEKVILAVELPGRLVALGVTETPDSGSEPPPSTDSLTEMLNLLEVWQEVVDMIYL